MDNMGWEVGICAYCRYTKMVHDWLYMKQKYCADCVGYLSQQANIKAAQQRGGFVNIPAHAILPEPPRNPELN